MAADEAPNLIVEVPKLRVSIGMWGALDCLRVRLQRVAQFSQTARDGDMRNRVPLTRQLIGQVASRLVRPQQVAHRVTGGAGFDQPRQYPLDVGISILEPLASAAHGANAAIFRAPRQATGLQLRQDRKSVV